MNALVESELVSAATLHGICCELRVDRARLLERLRSQGALCVEPTADQASVICELWQVTDGRSLFGGPDRARLVEKWAELAGDWLGLGLSALRALNQIFSLGPYRECLIAVPNVRLERHTERHALVLGMITDSPLALSIDRSFGYAYRKKLGQFQFAERRRFQVQLEHEVVLSGELADEGSELAGSDRAWLEDYWAQPLLGRLGPHDFRRSWLERRLTAPEARASRIAASVALSPLFELGAASGPSRVVSFSGVPARISLPRRLAG